MGQRDYRIDKDWEERRLREIINSGFFRIPIEIVNDKETQKKGIDIYIGSDSAELKIVRYFSGVGAITIETHSNLTKAPKDDIGDGWINYSEADWLIWVFIDKAYIWKMPDLRTWFYLQDVNKWEVFDLDNKYYTTRCRKVPIKDIPIKHWTRNYATTS